MNIGPHNNYGRPYRAWINAPSTLQLEHHMHGRYVIAVPESDGWVTVYFTTGETISARLPARAVSPGWPEHLRTAQPW